MGARTQPRWIGEGSGIEKLVWWLGLPPEPPKQKAKTPSASVKGAAKLDLI